MPGHQAAERQSFPSLGVVARLVQTGLESLNSFGVYSSEVQSA